MLRNLFEPLASAAKNLQHVTLLQGTKAYGAHIEPFPVPARERWPRHPHENFYWLQEDYLRDKQKGKDWYWTILRPQIIFGESLGSNMNAIPAIGVYAALLREAGLPLSFPGGVRQSLRRWMRICWLAHASGRRFHRNAGMRPTISPMVMCSCGTTCGKR